MLNIIYLSIGILFGIEWQKINIPYGLLFVISTSFIYSLFIKLVFNKGLIINSILFSLLGFLLGLLIIHIYPHIEKWFVTRKENSI